MAVLAEAGSFDLVLWHRGRDRRGGDPPAHGGRPTEIAISLLTPYFAHLRTEALGASAVLAAVTSGVWLGWRAPQLITPATRIQAYAFWEILISVLNAVLLVLVGAAAPGDPRHDHAEYSAGQLLGYGLPISATVIVVRFLWVFPVTYVPRWVSSGLRTQDPSPPWTSTFLVTVAGQGLALGPLIRRMGIDRRGARERCAAEGSQGGAGAPGRARGRAVGARGDGAADARALRVPGAVLPGAHPRRGRRRGRGRLAGLPGRLVVAGGPTGKVFVLSTRDGSTLKVLDTNPGATPAFLNDVAISRGFAYITDSQRPILYRVKLGKDAIGEIEPFVDFTGTAFAYQPGFNANGIAIDKGGRYAIVVQSGTGKLFSVDLTDKSVSEVDLGGQTVPARDGLLLDGNRL